MLDEFSKSVLTKLKQLRPSCSIDLDTLLYRIYIDDHVDFLEVAHSLYLEGRIQQVETIGFGCRTVQDLIDKLRPFSINSD